MAGKDLPCRRRSSTGGSRVSGPKPEVNLLVDDPALGATAASPLKGERSAYFPELGGFAEIPVFDRYGYATGIQLSRPGYRRGAGVDRRWLARGTLSYR